MFMASFFMLGERGRENAAKKGQALTHTQTRASSRTQSMPCHCKYRSAEGLREFGGWRGGGWGWGGQGSLLARRH